MMMISVVKNCGSLLRVLTIEATSCKKYSLSHFHELWRRKKLALILIEEKVFGVQSLDFENKDVNLQFRTKML